MKFPDDPKECSHCGRTNCVKLGDNDCAEARVKFFDELRARVEYIEKMRAIARGKA